jgi:hypothetical protein
MEAECDHSRPTLGGFEKWDGTTRAFVGCEGESRESLGCVWVDLGVL